jgi:hypothetical protein
MLWKGFLRKRDACSCPLTCTSSKSWSRSRTIERPQDAVGIWALVEVVDPEDERHAAEAARLVQGLGFHRDRDVVAGVNETLASRVRRPPSR